jgi:hypothetical protein
VNDEMESKAFVIRRSVEGAERWLRSDKLRLMGHWIDLLHFTTSSIYCAVSICCNQQPTRP